MDKCITDHNQVGIGKVTFLVFLLGLAGIVFYVLFAAFNGNPLFASITLLERVPPIVSIINKPHGLGDSTQQLQLKLTDTGAGIDEVVVRIIQKNYAKELFKKKYDTATLEDLIALDLNGKELGLREIEATLTITSFDRSLWSNTSSESFSLPVDFSKPKIEILSTQHNASRGGTELIFYRLFGKQVASHGVKIGKNFFPGFSVSQLDPVFANKQDLYFTFFAVPFDFNMADGTPKVVAADHFANIASTEFHYTIKDRKIPTVSLAITQEFITAKVLPLIKLYKERYNKTIGATDNLDNSQELITVFRVINEDFRALLENELRSTIISKLLSRPWHEPFIRPLNAAPRATFAEHRSYNLTQAPAGSSYHMGIDLAATANSIVRAAQTGQVIYADDFGIYGRTVILDHGFGLTSLYGHLSTIFCSVGDTVKVGTEIGQTGTTGLALGDHLHFEIRVHGIPVTPIEWWDAKWVTDHIEAKIESMRQYVEQP